LSVAEWARSRGIDGRSLNAWQVNLERRGASDQPRRRRRRKTKKASRALVELVRATPSVAASSGGRYVLEVVGARLEFGDDVSVATLRRVLEALRPC
jgi:hypothetical protein